jgi:lysophospholipase L1-like esterase
MILIVIILLGFGVCLVIAAIQRRYPRTRNVARALLVTYVTLMLILLAGEAYFRFVYDESDGLPTLALENWKAHYWKLNSAGYRDREWTENDWADKQTILIAGDSFAAGWGINDVKNRFGNVLGQMLGDQFAVINLGEPGASTVEDTENVCNYPLEKPDVVILQYYLNDIENAALSIGLDPHLNPTKDIPTWVNESFLANFIYWRLQARLQPEAQGTQTYWDWLYAMYDHATVWDIHQKQLNAFIDLVESKDAQLVVVIFPNMLDPFSSIPYVDRVAQVFEARNYSGEHILKLFDAAEAMPLNERIVSGRDAHASAEFNQLVGEMLYKAILSL